MEGDILGFIGPNGAGKTTTIKLILGLQNITSGKVYINGYDIEENFKKAIENVGTIVESPDLYMYMSGYENLKLVANLYKNVDKKRIDEIVKLVGLENRIKDKVSKYSLGMRQRLGIAQAILHKPKLLILDEPTVGLDPKQIIEIRNLIKKLGKNHTLIISSHILSEISQICEKVIIINKGQIVAVDSPEHLEDTVNVENAINIIVEDKENKIESLKINGAKKIELIKKNDDNTKEYRIIPEKDYDIRKTIFSDLAKESITIFELKKPEITLEEAFMDLIKKNEKEKEEKVKQMEEEKKQKEEQKKQEKIEKKEQKQENKKNKKGGKK